MVATKPFPGLLSLLTLPSPVIKSISILNAFGFPISYVGRHTKLCGLTLGCYVTPCMLNFTPTYPLSPIRPFGALKILRPEDVDAIRGTLAAARPYMEELYVEVRRVRFALMYALGLICLPARIIQPA